MFSQAYRNLTGEETAEDIFRIAVTEFLKSEDVQGHFDLEYRGGKPWLVYEGEIVGGNGTFICHYQPDRMVGKILDACSECFDEIVLTQVSEGSNEVETYISDWEPISKSRAVLIRCMAIWAVFCFLHGLMTHQIEGLEDNFNEVTFLSTALMFHSMAKGIREADGEQDGLVLKNNIPSKLEDLIKKAAARKRKYLARLLENMPDLRVRLTRGRAPGSTKPLRKKLSERQEFIVRIQKAALEVLRSGNKGKLTKTAIAKALGCGSINTASGNNTALTTFNAKLKSLEINYEEVIAKMKLNK